MELINVVARATKGEKVSHFVDLVFDNGLILRGWRVMNGKNGKFLSSPSQTYEKDGKTNYYNYMVFDSELGGRDLQDQWQEKVFEKIGVSGVSNRGFNDGLNF